MGLPKITINIESGGLGRTATFNDGLTAIITTATAVTGKLTLAKPYVIYSLKEAEEKLGITEKGSNAFAYKIISDYYTLLGSNTALYFLGVAATVTMEEMLDSTKSYVKDLQALAKGNIRLIGVSRKSTTGVKLADGLDADVGKAVIKGHSTALLFQKKMMPFRIVIDCKDFNGNISELKNYDTASYNTCCLFLAYKENEKNARIGLFLGAVSGVDVERKISRVRNGALPITETAYIGNLPTEVLEDQWSSLHDKGYIFLRSYPGKTGYFFSSDRTATADTDDFAILSYGRVIDKALLVAYSTYLEQLNDEIPLNEEGKILTAVVKALQAEIEQSIVNVMNNAISSVAAQIDATQDVLSTQKIEIELRIIPLGYYKEIVVNLGLFNPNIK